MKSIAVIGAGAAGMFFASRIGGGLSVHIFEKNAHPMKKLLLTGGGRCNFTNMRVDSATPEYFYPRGAKNLRKPLKRFGAKSAVEFFESLGVECRMEDNFRMFPASGDSRDIANALLRASKNAGARIYCGAEVEKIELSKDSGKFLTTYLKDSQKAKFESDFVLLSTGGEWSDSLKDSLIRLGHSFEAPLPSLYSLNAEAAESETAPLSGISLKDAEIKLDDPSAKISARAQLLFTHFGFSGPAVLNFTGFGARELAARKYRFPALLNLIPEFDQNKQRESFLSARAKFSKKRVANFPLMGLPQKLWSLFALKSGIPGERTYSNLSKGEERNLCRLLSEFRVNISGKSSHKAELVVCGGIKTAEIDFSTMQSKIVPNLFFAGECIDVDAITGGFNLQAAWTMGEICAQSLASIIKS